MFLWRMVLTPWRRHARRQGRGQQVSPQLQRSSDAQCLLCELPPLVMEAIYKVLPQEGRRSLRLVCRGAQQCVESCARQLQLESNTPAAAVVNRQPLALRFSSVQHLVIIGDLPATRSGRKAQMLGRPSVPWLGVTSIVCKQITAATLAALLPALPNLTSCTTQLVHRNGEAVCPSTEEVRTPARLLKQGTMLDPHSLEAMAVPAGMVGIRLPAGSTAGICTTTSSLPDVLLTALFRHKTLRSITRFYGDHDEYSSHYALRHHAAAMAL